MKKLILICLIFPAIAMASNVPEETIILQAKNGDIHFDHARHKAVGIDCAACHHNGVEEGACRSCHVKKEKTPPTFKSVGHQLCKDCHKSSSVKTSCKTCHLK